VADRRKLGTKDMVMTMAVVLVVVAFIALYGSRVIFAPGAQPVSGDVPTADVIGGYRHAQESMDFTVTVPTGIPSSWHPNSFTTSSPTTDGAGTLPTVRGGWVTPDGAYVTLIESSGDEGQVLQNEIGSVGDSDAKTRAGGATWTVTDGRRSELAWIRTAGGTTLLITGNAPEQDFVTVAESVAAAN
jgi:hypothetical protein